jgi:putative nucleotidyltransferase with HDIG domain/PAS domain S-box-containing protein
MKSKLAITVILFGWFIFISYILFYDYHHYGNVTLKHFFSPGDPFELFFHFVILATLIGSTITGYLINVRKKLLVKTQQSEKELKHAAREWRTTFDSMPYGVMLVDKDFNIIRTNDYISKLLGISLKELVFNKKCYKLIHKSDRPIKDCPLVKSIETQNTETFEYHEPALNKKYFRVIVTPLFGEEGAPIAYVHSLIDITDIKQQEKKLTQSRDAFFNMLKDLDLAYKELKGVYHELIIAFSNAMDAKSQWTRGHSERVTKYAISIANELDLKEKDIETLKTAALLHDIGKIGTYDMILDKPDKLTDDEFSLVKRHTIKGEEILRPIKELEHILPVIRSHHEKVDGSGYPDGLKGDEIPLLARIIRVADAFDSMTSDRPYRPASAREYAISELKRCSGTHFDPKIVEAFLKVLEKEKANNQKLKVES